VILEAGIASFSSNWVRVQQALEPHARVVSYDRAGLGWSDPPPEAQDAAQSAAQLHAALRSAGIRGPYVVVGHSYGGLVVRAFADLYPDEVVGMVLVDASHPDQWAAIPLPGAARLSGLVNRALGALAQVGVVRLLGLNRSLGSGLPERQAAEMEAALARPRTWYTSGAVIGIWDSRTAPQIHRARDLGDLPLVALSSPERPGSANLGGFAELLDAQQSELANLSSNSLHRTVEGSTHESLVNEPEHAQAVVEAILQVVQAAESGTPLTMVGDP
jgi:pimeloyl-ACP methyl ester carboxylesterase